MKKNVAILFCSVFVALILSSFNKANSNETTVADYTGFYEDEDLNEKYYSFESDDEYLEFVNVKQDLVSKFLLEADETLGKSFEIEYSRDQETDMLTLVNLVIKG